MNQYPWLVSIGLVRRNNHICGGTLVASRYVISAAHCFVRTDDSNIVMEKLSAEDLQLRVGDHDLGEEGETILKQQQIRED